MNGILLKPGDILKHGRIKQPILLFWHFSRLASIIRCMKVHCQFAFQLGLITGFDVFRPQRVGKSFLPAESSLISRCLATHGCAGVWRIEVLRWWLWGNLWLNQSWACHGYLDVSGKRGLSPCRCRLSFMSACQIKHGCLPHDTITPHHIDGTLPLISWQINRY